MRYIYNRFRTLSTLILSTMLCTTSVTIGEDIRLGATLILSGEYAPQGEAFRSGIEIALQEANEAGGVHGKPLQLIAEDTEFNFPRATSAAKKLLEIDHVSLLFAMTYSETQLLAPLAQKAEVPLLSLWDSSPAIETLGNFVFGLGPWTPSVGEKSASFAVSTLRAKRAAIIGTEDNWSHSIANNFRESFERRGGILVAEKWQNPKDSDFRSLILNLGSLDIDVLYAPVALNIPAFYRQLKTAKFKKPVITADVLSEHIIAQSGDSTEGVYQTELHTPTSSIMAELLDKYHKKYKKDCAFPPLLALGYDGARFAVAGLKASSREHGQPLSHAALVQGLLQLRAVPGAFGAMTPNAQGSIRRPVSMYQVKNGHLILIEE